MRAWRLSEVGEPRNVMHLSVVAQPVPASRQILVRVRGAALNFADALMCRGTYQVRPRLPFTPGVEVCGEVTQLGPGVDGLARGDRVIGSTVAPAGGFAEYSIVNAARAHPAPAALDDAAAAAFYIAYQTGWVGLHRRAGLQTGETLLVHAAAGGVGSAAVQLGKAAGAFVIGVAGGRRKAEMVSALGADIVVNHHHDDFVAVVNDATNGHGADVIYDPVGGEVFRRSTKCVAFEGRIVIVGFAGGQVQSPPLNHALVKNYSIVGLHWGLYQDRDPGTVASSHAELCRLTELGAIAPLVGERLEMRDVADALQRLADGTTLGRLVMLPQLASR